jgi:azurin
MKAGKIIPGLLSLSAAFLMAGCGGGSPTEVQRPAADEPLTPIDGPITITGNDQMQFSPTEFAVRAGSEVELVFHNIGTMPKETMGHNLVILQQGVDGGTFAAASIRFPDNEYIAPDREDEVVAATRVLGPGEQETLTFTAPEETGDYPFVCSFPGHTPAGMVGVMRVVE